METGEGPSTLCTQIENSFGGLNRQIPQPHAVTTPRIALHPVRGSLPPILTYQLLLHPSAANEEVEPNVAPQSGQRGSLTSK